MLLPSRVIDDDGGVLDADNVFNCKPYECCLLFGESSSLNSSFELSSDSEVTDNQDEFSVVVTASSKLSVIKSPQAVSFWSLEFPFAVCIWPTSFNVSANDGSNSVTLAVVAVEENIVIKGFSVDTAADVTILAV